ncbi:MAG: DUF362 domain-containing protein [Deltaproteobacteria bacterium]|nr:DUF362 domain-containing protein [Deltaproteobacteria bacterium]
MNEPTPASSATPPVGITRYEPGRNSLRAAIEWADGFRDLDPSTSVLIKPNIIWGGGGSKKIPRYGMITTARIVEDLVVLLREHGCTDISIGEGTVADPQMGSTTSRGFTWSGIRRVAQQHRVRLVDFNAGPHEPVDLGGIQARISTHALRAGFLISVPVLKTHAMTKVSLGLKNLKGCLSMGSKKRFHQHGLDELIARNALVLQPKLTVIDGIYALAEGPTSLGAAYRFDLIAVSRDALTCDAAGSALLGIDPTSVEHLVAYADLVGRSPRLEAVPVRGVPLDEVSRSLSWEANTYEDVLRRAQISGVTVPWPGKRCCTLCATGLGCALVALAKDVAGRTFDGVEICAGADVRAQPRSKKVILVGDCAARSNADRRDAVAVRGCPVGVTGLLSTLAIHTLGLSEGLRVLAPRALKTLAHRLGLCDELFPAYRTYSPPEFDPLHFS